MITTYEQGRNVIEDGDVVFVRNPHKFLARLYAAGIRFVTKSNYSHVGIAFWAELLGSRRLMIVEAQGGTRRRILNFSYYQYYDVDVVQRPPDWDAHIDRAVERIGQARYGWIQAYYIGIREFFLRYLRIRLPALNLPGEICSEFVADVYDLPEKYVSPQLLFEQLRDVLHLPIRAEIRG